MRTTKEPIYRILDANLNRATEGLRVCEEITRFLLNDRRLTIRLKNFRHGIFKIINTEKLTQENLIRKRDSKQDVGKDVLRIELKRDNYRDVFFANIQRVKESIRVLEEFCKLVNKDSVIRFKRLRYQTYEIEKEIALKLATLSHPG